MQRSGAVTPHVLWARTGLVARLGMPPGVGGSQLSSRGSDVQQAACAAPFRPTDRCSQSAKSQNADLDAFAFNQAALGAYAKARVGKIEECAHDDSTVPPGDRTGLTRRNAIRPLGKLAHVQIPTNARNDRPTRLKTRFSFGPIWTFWSETVSPAS